MAKLHMGSIAEKLTRKVVRRALEELPRELDATYDDAIHRMELRSRKHVVIAKKVLCLVAFALRPLSITELKHALAIEPRMCDIEDDDLLDDEMMILACVGLVTVKSDTKAVRLVRKSS
jgi:hypothetical protein